LTRVLQLQAAVSDTQRNVTQADAERQQVVQEQARCATTSPACRPTRTWQRRYLATLDKQETEIEAIASAAPMPRRPSRRRVTPCGPTWRQLG